MLHENHRMTGRLLTRVGQADIWLCSCDPCGPQLLVTADWEAEEVRLFWVRTGTQLVCSAEGDVTTVEPGEGTHGT